MHIEQTKLPSGLVVITSSSPYLESAAFGAFVNAGSRQETIANNGVAHFLEHLMFKGTSTRTAYDIATQIEVLGSDINAFTSMDMTAYHSTGLGKNIGEAVAIIGDALTDSKFDPDDIALESGVIIQEINRHDDSPGSVMYDALQAMSYQQQPYGRPILGSPEFVKTATATDFRAFTREFYTADNIVVTAAGGIDHDTFVRQVETAFGGLPVTATRRSTIPATYVGGTKIDRSRDFKQVSAGIAFNAVPILDEKMYHYVLLADAFGGGMSSPLFMEIREKRGLVYSTGSYASLGVDNGRIMITGGMTPDNVEEFVTVACAEFRKMCDTINDVDLTRAKNSHLAGLATLREKPYSTATFMARSYWQRGRVRDLEEMRDAIQAVTVDDLKAAAATVVASVPTIALVGPVPEHDYSSLVRTALV